MTQTTPKSIPDEVAANKPTKINKIGEIISNNQRFLPLSATIVLFFVAYAIGAYSYNGMRDPQVFLNLFRTCPFLLISAIGSTFVILTGGIDLSVSGVVALTTVASAALLRSEESNPWTVILLMLAMGTVLGATMGFFITYMKVQPFIATLAGMWFARGMCFFISDDAININNRVYRILGQTKILIPGLSDPSTQQGDYISILVVLEIIVVLAAIYLAHYTRFGRNVYAIGGSEQSAHLMGLPVNRTKLLVYALNGFCSALAGITLSIYVSSGHGLYAQGFELQVIASVVIGGTMLTGGVGYVFGTLFGVLIMGLIQTLIQFNGNISSWWTPIVVGMLTLVFIGAQSLLAARKSRQLAGKRLVSQLKGKTRAKLPQEKRRILTQLKRWQKLALGGSATLIIILGGIAINNAWQGTQAAATDTPKSACQLQPFRQDHAAELIADGAIIAYERNGGSGCIDELFAIYPNGRIVGDNGIEQIEKQSTVEEIEQLLLNINDQGWFTEEMYSTSHIPCAQCYTYFITVSTQDNEKTVKAVDGGTDAPANYWQVVSLLNGVLPKFEATP